MQCPNYPEPCFPSPRGLSRRYGFHHQSRFFGKFRLNIQVFNLARNIFPGGFIAGSTCSGSPVPALLFPTCPGVREQRRLPSLCIAAIAAIADRLTYPPPRDPPCSNRYIHCSPSREIQTRLSTYTPLIIPYHRRTPRLPAPPVSSNGGLSR